MSEAPRPNPTYHEITFSSDWLKYKNPEYFAYRKMWDEAPRTMARPPFPMNVDIEPNTTCDMLCPMCDRTILIQKDRFDGKQTITMEEYRDLIDQCAEMGTFAIKFASLGEPLLHPKIGELISYAKSKGIRDVILNTNGTLLGRRGEEILAAGVDKVHVSFDSPYPEEYAKIRVGGDFEKNRENVIRFSELRRKKYPHVHLRVSMVVFDDSAQTTKKIKDMADLFRPHVDALGMTTALDYEDKSVRAEIPGFRCGQLVQRICLAMTGVVTMCCWHVEEDHPIGDWRKDRLRDIWNSPGLLEVFRKHVEGKYFDVDVCRRCAFPPAERLTESREISAGSGGGVLKDFAENLVRP